MTLLEILIVLAGLALMMIGAMVGVLYSPLIGAIIAGVPIALMVLAPVADAVITWLERRPKPLPGAIAIKR